MDGPDGVSERVRALIAATGRSQREYAAALGLDETKLSKSLAGRRRFSASELVAIARRGGVTVNWLLHGRDDAPTVSAVPAPTTRPARPGGADPLLGTAWELVAARGHHRVDADAIAQAAGTDVATVRLRFPDPGDVLREVLRHSVGLAFDRQVAGLHGVDDAHERLHHLVELQLPTEGLLRAEWSVWLQVWTESALDPELRSLYWDSYDRWHRTIAMTLRRGQEHGAFRPGDPDETATELTALIDGLGLQVLTGRPGSSVAAMRAHLHDHIARTIVSTAREGT